jgi:hypothetical protein
MFLLSSRLISSKSSWSYFWAIWFAASSFWGPIAESIPFYCVPWPAKMNSFEFSEKKKLLRLTKNINNYGEFISLTILLLEGRKASLNAQSIQIDTVQRKARLIEFIIFIKCQALTYQAISLFGCRTSTKWRHNNTPRVWERSPPSLKSNNFGRSFNFWSLQVSSQVDVPPFRLRHVPL